MRKRTGESLQSSADYSSECAFSVLDSYPVTAPYCSGRSGFYSRQKVRAMNAKETENLLRSVTLDWLENDDDRETECMRFYALGMIRKSPAWHDRPTCAGNWVIDGFRYYLAEGQWQNERSALRVYGPIPNDPEWPIPKNNGTRAMPNLHMDGIE